MTDVGASELPRLAIFHDSSSAPIFELVDAAKGVCRLVWVVGWSGEETPARLLARFGEVLDLSGLEEEPAIDKVVAGAPAGVVVFNDRPLQIAAEVAVRGNLPFHSPSTARLLTDKLAQREVLRDAGLQVPLFAPVDSSDFETEVPFPAVLKPRFGAGSRNTFRVEDARDVVSALAKCPSGEKFILEEILTDRSGSTAPSADIVSVESIVRGSDIQHVMVTGRLPFAPPFRESGSFMPSELSASESESVTELAAVAARVLGITLGVLHTEIKMTPEGPRLVEVNGRLGGVIDLLTSRLGGPSLTTWAMKLALGLEPGQYPEITNPSVSFFRLILAPPTATSVVSVDGLVALSELPGVDAVESRRQPGDSINTQNGYSGYVLKVDGLVGSHAELFALMTRIDSTLVMAWGFD